MRPRVLPAIQIRQYYVMMSENKHSNKVPRERKLSVDSLFQHTCNSS